MRRIRVATLVPLVALLFVAGCGGPALHRASGARSAFEGVASYYHDSLHGNLTANGETYDREALTAAHRTLPFGTVVDVKNRANGKVVRLRINDRGPFVRGRVIDLSRRGARELGFLKQGLADVRVEIVSSPGP